MKIKKEELQIRLMKKKAIRMKLEVKERKAILRKRLNNL